MPYQEDPKMYEDMDFTSGETTVENSESNTSSEAKPRKKKKTIPEVKSSEKGGKELHHFNLAIDKGLFTYLKAFSAIEGITVTDFIIRATTKELLSKYKNFDINKFCTI